MARFPRHESLVHDILAQGEPAAVLAESWGLDPARVAALITSKATEQRQRATDRHTLDFGGSISGVLTALADSATVMQGSAREMAKVAQDSHFQADHSAAEVAASMADLTAVTAATEQLSASAREIGSRVADAAVAYPGRIIPFCRIDPTLPIGRVLADADATGVRGVKLHPVAQRFHPEGEECVRVVREATDRGWPVLFHAGFGARPLGDAFARLIDQVPDARLILAHGGRGDHRALAAATAGHPGVLFDSSIAALPDLLTLAPERIVFGSDRPYGDHAQALHLVGVAARVAGWDDTAVRGVLGETLLKWIGPVGS